MHNLSSIMNMPVENIIEKRRLLQDNDRVSRALGEIREGDYYEVFIDRGSKVAICTVRDILAVSRPEETRLSTISYNVPTIDKNDSIGRAAKIMFDYRLRALPLYREDGHVMVVSAKGICREIAEQSSVGIDVSQIMSPNPVTIDPKKTVLKARDIMLRRNFDHLPMVSNGKVIGMITSHNLLYSLLPAERMEAGWGRGEKEIRLDFPVERIAERIVIEVSPDTDVADAARKILSSRFTYSVVTLWGELQGIITLRDITRVLIARERKERAFYIVGLPNEPFESEAVKMKFDRLANLLVKTFPHIQEIRSIIKTKEIGKGKRRYEVSVNLYAKSGNYSYVDTGYELVEIFDSMVPKLKKMISSRRSKVTGTAGESIRRQGSG